jgi:DNA-binding transcriptional regulator GbsR (MarR family)
MIQFEQHPRDMIEEIIRDEVYADANGDLYGVDRAVDHIYNIIYLLQGDIEILFRNLEKLNAKLEAK